MYVRFIFLLLCFGCDENSSSKVNPQQNSAPEATISSHADGALFVSGESIEFIGGVTDVEDGSEELQVVWPR